MARSGRIAGEKISEEQAVAKSPKSEGNLVRGISLLLNGRSSPVQHVPVGQIRPEEGLGRKRDRDGHRELQRSIEQFGVLTPITVRRAPDGSGDYLLIKGQGRTLACRILGIETIPAIVVDSSFAEDNKVQQFLVENVARLKMHPVDRALLIHRAREDGEETTDIARRFGVGAVTVRRLLAQLEGASSSEVATLRAREVNLAMHAVVARHVAAAERTGVLKIIARTSLKSKELEALFVALGWSNLAGLGKNYCSQRLALLSWACATLSELPSGSMRERLRQLALKLPMKLNQQGSTRLPLAR
jgi:ParB/RepB/Spo0J family partition protein